MQNSNNNISLLISDRQLTERQNTQENYATILEQFGAPYHKVDYYWQVGVSRKTQGWILHLSVIAPQIAEILQVLVPVFLAQKIVFKLPFDKSIARDILIGNVGYEQLGKVITIYPENESVALSLAKQLIALTSTFRGPAIPTDRHLGGIVYTRYGSINPIMQQGENGVMEKYIHGPNGELIKDNYPIPFQLPNGIAWPFGELTVPEIPKTNKNLRNIYKPITILKPDARGNVVKSLYLKGFMRVGTCIIKEGKKNMLADDQGRDIQHRLRWQKELHEKLGNTIRLPRILDYFEENDVCYLAMEFIKGQSLQECLISVHRNQNSWFQLTKREQLTILDWIIKIVGAIKKLHEKGFVHRDIAPGNFMIDEKGQLVLIDIELAYDLKNGNQEMPLELGTPGFMSPEQEAVSIPTVKEDIYGLGALMINCFTCLSATRFNTADAEVLFQNLYFFIQNRAITELIVDCLQLHPQSRPDIQNIQSVLEEYKSNLLSGTNNHQELYAAAHLPVDLLQATVSDALQGLGKKPMPVHENLWMSKTIQLNGHPGNIQKDYSPYCGIHTGMTGVLYLLARAKELGYELDDNRPLYKQCWKYIYSEYLNKLDVLGPGLYHGTAGIALALAEGLKADLLEDSELIRTNILKCLQKPTEQLTIAEGCAGQGIVLLQCEYWLPREEFKTLLDNCVTQILSQQKKDGSWNSTLSNGKPHSMSVSWSQGSTGIIYFLLAYHFRYKDPKVLEAANNSLRYLLKRTQNLQSFFNQAQYQLLLGNQPEVGDERTSVILCFIQAYHFLQDPVYRKVAENALYRYPEFVVNTNFSQEGGMAALGELYCEAWRVFNNEDWKKRVLRMAAIFLHTSYREKDESCYWTMEETGKPTADLLSGNSGIIHFLLRCTAPEKLGHILLI